MALNARCWFCSEEIASTERAKVVGDLNVLVHVGCFDRLYETEGVKSWWRDRRAAGDPKRPTDEDEDEEEVSA